MVTIRKNLRQGPDGTVKFVRLITLLSWVLLFSAFILISLARPRYDTMFERVYNTFSFGSYSMSMWDKSMLRYTFYILLSLTGLSIIGVILNGQRHKRKRDRYNKSLFITGIAAFAGSILYYIFYLL
jgi:hypothetical protein